MATVLDKQILRGFYLACRVAKIAIIKAEFQSICSLR